MSDTLFDKPAMPKTANSSKLHLASPWSHLLLGWRRETEELSTRVCQTTCQTTDFLEVTWLLADWGRCFSVQMSLLLVVRQSVRQAVIHQTGWCRKTAALVESDEPTPRHQKACQIACQTACQTSDMQTSLQLLTCWLVGGRWQQRVSRQIRLPLVVKQSVKQPDIHRAGRLLRNHYWPVRSGKYQRFSGHMSLSIVVRQPVRQFIFT